MLMLQEVVDLLSEHLPLDEGSLVDDILPSIGDVIEKLAETHAAAHGVPSSRGELAVLADQALRHPAMYAAFRAPRLWSEIPSCGEDRD